MLTTNTLEGHLALALLYLALVSSALFIAIHIGWFSSGWGGRFRGDSPQQAPGLITNVDIPPMEDDWSSLSW